MRKWISKKALRKKLCEAEMKLSAQRMKQADFINMLWDRQQEFEGDYREGLYDAYELSTRYFGKVVTGHLSDIQNGTTLLNLSKTQKIRGEEEE
jgi:hypothetical protein